MRMATVTTKGQIVIPSHLRHLFGIKKGTRLYIETHNDEIVLRPATRQYFEKLTGILPEKGKGLNALMEYKKKERKL